MEDCLEHPLLFTNGPGIYYTQTNGIIRNINSILVNCSQLYFPYKYNGDWVVNIQTGSNKGVMRKPLHDMIVQDQWEVRLASGN